MYYPYSSVIIPFFQRIIRRHGRRKTLFTRFRYSFHSRNFSPSVKGFHRFLDGGGKGKINKGWLRGSSISRKVNRWIGKGERKKEKEEEEERSRDRRCVQVRTRRKRACELLLRASVVREGDSRN